MFGEFLTVPYQCNESASFSYEPLDSSIFSSLITGKVVFLKCFNNSLQQNIISGAQYKETFIENGTFFYNDKTYNT